MIKSIHSMPYITSSGVTNMHFKKQLVSKSFVETSNQVSLLFISYLSAMASLLLTTSSALDNGLPGVIY